MSASRRTDTGRRQLAAAHAQLAGPLRALAERSLRALEDARVAERLTARLAPPHAPPRALRPASRAALCEALAIGARDLATARVAVGQNAAAAAAALAATHAQRAALAPAARSQAAWRALRGCEHAWEPICRDIGQLLEFALRSGEALQQKLPALAAAAAPDDVADGLAGDEALARDTSGEDPQVVEGATAALQLLAQAGSLMAQLKAEAPFEAYLAAGAALLSLLTQYLAGCAQALELRLHTLANTRRLLAADCSEAQAARTCA